MTEVCLLTRKKASSYLREKYDLSRTPATLARMASEGTGPDFQRLGREVFYRMSDLDGWVEENLTPPASSTLVHDHYQNSDGNNLSVGTGT